MSPTLIIYPGSWHRCGAANRAAVRARSGFCGSGPLPSAGDTLCPMQSDDTRNRHGAPRPTMALAGLTWPSPRSPGWRLIRRWNHTKSSPYRLVVIVLLITRPWDPVHMLQSSLAFAERSPAVTTRRRWLTHLPAGGQSGCSGAGPRWCP